MTIEPSSTDPTKLPIGSHHYRAYVGPPQKYDEMAAIQFTLMFLLGLREDHRLLDIGCGSLRGGRLFIPYLLPDRYFGVEPNEWLLADGIKNEIGEDLVRIKNPRFSNDSNFDLSSFSSEFDFILAQSIFSHASSAQIDRCLSQAAKVMGKDAIFAATYVKGDQNYEGDTWAYPECVTFRVDFLEAVASKYSLNCRELPYPHPNGQTWVAFYRPGREEPRLRMLSDLYEEIALLNERANRPWRKRLLLRLRRVLGS